MHSPYLSSYDGWKRVLRKQPGFDAHQNRLSALASSNSYLNVRSATTGKDGKN